MMKSTGIVRKVDELGRVVIPKELRKTLGIDEKDPLEIFMDGDRIVLKKYAPGCVLCGSIEGLISFYPDKLVCNPCIQLAAKEAASQKKAV